MDVHVSHMCLSGVFSIRWSARGEGGVCAGWVCWVHPAHVVKVKVPCCKENNATAVAVICIGVW